MRQAMISRTGTHRQWVNGFWCCCLITGLTGICGVIRAADAAAGKPATVAEAAKVIDLSTFPLLPGADLQGRRRVAKLSYNAESTVAKAFEFQKQKLAAGKWKELPNSYVSEQAANATYSRDGYTVSLSVIAPGKPGSVMVLLTNHGNVDVKKLPIPKDAKPLYSSPVSTAYVTPEAAEKTAGALRKLLTAQGWQPYGAAGDTQFYKQNAVLLTARAAVAPAQEGKTVIDYSTELMSVEIPAPAETLSLQYADVTAQLLFDTAAASDEIFSFYRKTLASAGWKATTEKPFNSDFKQMLIFRNPAKDMLRLETYTVDEKLRVIVKQQSAAEVAEIEQELQAKNERQKQEKAEKAKNQPQIQAAVKLPAGAKDVKRMKEKIEFTVAAGKGQSTVADLQKQFGKANWKEELATLEQMAGTVTFTRDDKEVMILYIDTGFMPAEITISGTGIDVVEVKGAK